MFKNLGRMTGLVSDNPLWTGFAVLSCGAVFASIEYVVHHAVVQLRGPELASIVNALVVGVAAGIASWALLRGNRDRRRRLRTDLLLIAELNHEIRNALQVIASSHHDADRDHREMVMTSVARIDRVLKQAFSILGGR